MFALYVALLAAVWMSSFEGAEAQNYTVHSSVTFARTGDRTPLLMTQSPQLTSLGAQQMYHLGAYFRRRYIDSGDDVVTGSSVLTGLSSGHIDNDQVFVQAIDTEFSTTSAQAFMQAFYPPKTLNNVTAAYLDPSALLANNSYIETPMNGYQYPMISTVGEFDPYSIFLTGTTNCAYFDESAFAYYNSDAFNDTEGRTRTMYQALGHAVLEGILPNSQWSFQNGYMIYDYVSYQNLHNSSAKEVLSGPAYRDNIDQLAALAAEKQYAIYGDLSASGVEEGDHIRAIAGRTLAARILGLLMDNMGSSGAESKFSLLVGEYPPMLSFFALMHLPHADTNFKYIPPFGSAMTFELFSWENGTGVSNSDGAQYPSQDDLWVRFLYINGSTTDENPLPSIQAYPLFDQGPSKTDMKWSDFETFMLNIMLSDIGTWCQLCGETSIFCPAFVNATGGGSSGATTSSRRRHHSSVSPAVAGVIGAIVTLAIAALLIALAALLFGVRIYRNNGRRTSDLGGFKGSRKLASDPDLNLPKHGGPVGVVAAVDDKKMHERVGSWELGQKEVERGTFGSLGGSTVTEGTRKPSFEGDFERGADLDHDHDHDDINPFQEPTQVRRGI